MYKYKTLIVFNVLLIAQVFVLPGKFSVDIFKACFVVLIVSLAMLSMRNHMASINQVSLVLVFCVGVFFVVSMEKISVDSIVLQWLYLFYCSIVLVFFVFSDTNLKEVFKQITFSFCFAGLIASILGFYEYFYFDLLGRSSGALIPYLLPPNVSLRVGGFYGQPNLFSVFLLCCLVSYCYAYSHQFSFETVLARWFGWIPFVVVATCFFMTGSMSGLLSLLLFLCAFVCFFFSKSHYFNLSKTKYLRIILMFCFAYLIYWCLGTTSSGTVGISKTGISADARFTWWASAFLMWKENPLIGVGLGNFKFYVDEYLLKAHDLLGFVEYESMGYTNWAHNEFFQLLSEVGVLGIFALIIFIFFLAQMIRKNLSTLPLEFYYSLFFMIPFCVVGMFSWPFRHAGLLVLFLFFLSLIIAWLPCKIIFLQRPLFSRLVEVFFVLSIVSSGLVLYWDHSLISFYKTEKKANQINLFAFESMVAHKFNSYPLSFHLTPYYVQTILTHKNREQGEQLLPYLERLAVTQGAHWQWYNLGIIHRFLGNLTEADYALNEAINRIPSSDRYWHTLHLINLEAGLLLQGKTLESYLSQEASPISFEHMEIIKPESATIY